MLPGAAKHSCILPQHEGNSLNYVCIQEECTQSQQRLSCAHCLLEFHSQHTGNHVPVHQFMQLVIGKFQDRFSRIEDL
jgi:hypothetical protein